MEPSQLYSQAVRQINNLKSQSASLSIEGSPAIYSYDVTILTVSYFSSKKLHALFEVMESTPRKTPSAKPHTRAPFLSNPSIVQM